MAYTFYETCPKCNTQIRVIEGGTHYPARSHDPIYCPVCNEIVCYKNTMYDFYEHVESLESTLEPYKSEYLTKHKNK